MKISNRKVFCRLLAQWLHASEWHFTTLLAITIESTQNLPDNADSLINSLLLNFPIKPSASKLSSCLQQSDLIETWFQKPAHRPAIRTFNLTEITAYKQEELPELASTTTSTGLLSQSTPEEISQS